MSDEDDWEKPNFEAPTMMKTTTKTKDSWEGEDEESEEENGEKTPPTKTGATTTTPTENGADDGGIDRLHPVTAPEFETLREKVEKKLAPLEASPFYNGFVDDLIRDLCMGLPPESLKKINSGLTLIINEKTAASKPKAKKGKKGPTVKMDRDIAADVDVDYDDFDDMM